MRMRRLALAAAILAVAGASCRGCAPGGPGSVRELAGPDAAAAFVVDDLGKVMTSFDAFLAKLTQKAGAAQLAQTRASLKQQFDLDPLDPKSFETFGVDTGRGLIVFTEGKETAPILALAVADTKKLDASLKSTVSKADGASKFSSEPVGPYTLNVAGRPFGSEVAPAMLWAHVGRFVLIARADGRAAMQAALERLAAGQGKPARSLATDATFRELSQKLKKADVVIFGRGAAAAALTSSGGAPLSKGTITGVTLGSQGVESETFLSLAIPHLDQALAGPPVADLASRIGDDAVLVALSRAARPDALAALRGQPTASALIDRALSPLRDEVGLDPEKDILPLLAGPFTASVHVESLEGVATQVRQRTASVRGMIDYVHVVLTAEVKDPKGMLAVLDRSRDALQKRGLVIAKRTVKVGGKDAVVYAPEPRGAPPGTAPKLGWALLGDTYVYAAGPGRLERALAVIASGGPSIAGKLGDAGQKLASEAGSTVVVVRAGAIADQARAVVPPAGGAQGGFDAIVSGVVELLRSLGDVAAAVTAEPDGMRLRIQEQLQ